jgi:hypothetical protein
MRTQSPTKAAGRPVAMGVRINKGPIAATDLPSDLTTPDQWRTLTGARRTYLEIHLPSDCRMLLRFVEEADELYAGCGFASAEAYIRDGLGLDPVQVGWAIDGLRRMKPDEPIPYTRAIELGKRGRPKKGGEEKGDNVTLKSRGHSRAYILARLDRDGHADLAAKVRAGKLSANAAAIEAGFRKQLTPLERIRKLVPALTTGERRDLVRELLLFDTRGALTEAPLAADLPARRAVP